jgi:hypothetical protein
MKTLDRTSFTALLETAIGEIQYRARPRVAKHRKKEEEAIVRAGIVLPIFKSKVGSPSRAIIGQRYTDAVNGERRLEGMKGDFVSEAPRGKKFVEGSAVLMESLRDPSVTYVAVRPLPTEGESTIEFRDSAGRVLTEEEAVMFLQKSEVAPSGGSSRQGTEEAILWITPKIEGFSWVKIGGVEYTIS